MLVIPNPLPRGLYVTGFFLYGHSLAVFAVTSAHQCLRHQLVSSHAELEAVSASLASELDAADPPPSEFLAPPGAARLRLVE